MMNTLKGRDIVIVGLQPWDTAIGSNCKNIALEFSKNNRVLYVNSPLDRITKLRRSSEPAIQKRLDILNGKLENLELVAPNLWVYYPDVVIESINWLRLEFLFDFLNKANNKMIAGSISKALVKLNFVEIILFNDNDIFRSFYLKDYLKPAVTVYYSRDYLLGVNYWRRHGVRLEPQLMAKSDICVANSSYLTDLCRVHNQKSFYVGQGCEVELFLNAYQEPIPSDMVDIKGPIIGYIGVLETLRLDIEIIDFVAQQKPEWNIVLVGPEGLEFRNSKLHQLNNVFFLGAKDPLDLPAYVNGFSVCINPQIVNDVTIGNYPRKIDEYLAAGKPVVATSTKAMDVFEDYCFLANNKEEYVEFIQQALAENRAELSLVRKEFASTHTWENSVNEIYKSILNS
ncbi:MAG: glycosyltransferase [Bacteroidota bacterium]